MRPFVLAHGEQSGLWSLAVFGLQIHTGRLMRIVAFSAVTLAIGFGCGGGSQGKWGRDMCDCRQPSGAPRVVTVREILVEDRELDVRKV